MADVALLVPIAALIGTVAYLLGHRRGARKGRREPALRLAALLHHVETCPDCLLRMRNCGAPFVVALRDATIYPTPTPPAAPGEE